MASTRWCFTLNNPSEKEVSDTKNADSVFIIFGSESVSTAHLQGFVIFKKPKRLAAMKKWLPRAHFERAKGTSQQNVDYCSKQDPNPFIQGDLPDPKNAGKATQDRYAEAKKLAIEGKFDDISPDLYVRHYSTWKRLHDEHAPPPVTIDGDLQHEWIYGPTGTGKSTAARTENPEHYLKRRNKWWCNYQGQHTVIIEEWSPYDVALTGELKEWADRHPLPERS